VDGLSLLDPGTDFPVGDRNVLVVIHAFSLLSSETAVRELLAAVHQATP
jgi:hypothetical protein